MKENEKENENTEEKDYEQFVGCFIHKIDYQLI